MPRAPLAPQEPTKLGRNNVSSTTLARLALPLLVSGTCLITAAQAAPSDRAILNGSTPGWANSQNFVANADPSTDVGFRVYLGWNNPDAVTALAAAVSNPASASYGHYLTPTQFRKQFAPS